MTCSSCNKQRADLHAKKSRLKSDQMLYLCSECIQKKMEPRYLVIMYGRDKGIDAKVVDIIKNRRYVGEDILAKEILK